METIYRDERCPDIEIRWNHSATFNVWVKGPAPHGYYGENGWWNQDCFTRYGKTEPGGPCTPAEAEQAAQDHFDEWAEEADEE